MHKKYVKIQYFYSTKELNIVFEDCVCLWCFLQQFYINTKVRHIANDRMKCNILWNYFSFWIIIGKMILVSVLLYVVVFHFGTANVQFYHMCIWPV